jgi:hypothetical protein
MGRASSLRCQLQTRYMPEDLPSSGVPSTLPGRELPGVLPAGVSIPVSLGGLMTPLAR